MDHFDIEFIEHLIFIVVGVVAICLVTWDRISKRRGQKDRNKE